MAVAATADARPRPPGRRGTRRVGARPGLASIGGASPTFTSCPRRASIAP